MMPHLLLVAVLAAVVWPGSQAFADDRGIGLYVDQDFFLPGRNEDRDYTMGLAVEVYREEKQGEVPFLDWALNHLDGWLKPEDAGGDARLHRSLQFGATTFTPDDIGNPNPLFDDRPYASVIYLSVKRVEANEKFSVGTDLQLGVLGLNLANQVQTAIHQNNRAVTGNDEPVDPKGWGNQISDGGEPTVRYRFNMAKRIADQPGRWDLAAEGGFSVGYQTNASVGLSGRLGIIDSNFWTLPYDPINRGSGIPSTGGNEIYLWSAYRARVIGYDAMLQGQFRNSDVTVSSSAIKRLVHEAGVGLTMAWERLALTLALNAKSGEMEGPADRTHVWGGVYANFRF